jgi:hypothetical protein
MLTYLAAAVRFQSECRSPASRAAAWLRRQIDAHRARRAERRNRSILSGLDRRILADIGFATGAAAEIAEPVTGLSVQAMVAGALAHRITRP